MKVNFKKKLKDINTFIFDVDGVLTDGGLYILPSGEFMRKMNAKDGYALKAAMSLFKHHYLCSEISHYNI